MLQITGRALVARIGATVWILGAAVFFACQFIAQSAWQTPYSWSANNVSDLGNVYCQPWGDNHRYVCSPLHDAMNAGVVAEGILIIVGMLLLGYLWKRGVVSVIARSLIVFGAAGYALAGFAPADVSEKWHVFGAFLIAFLGLPGLFLTGFQMQSTRPAFFRWLATIIGGVGLLATFHFFSQHYLGLGMGGMERLWGFNLPIWTLATGSYVLLSLRSGNQLAPSTPVTATARVEWENMARHLDGE